MSTTSTITVPRSTVTITAHGQTDVGLRRRTNEDSFIEAAPVFAVADGMGGHSRGDLASKTMIDQLSDSIRSGEPTTPEVVFTAITAANSKILKWAGDVGVAGTTIAGIALVSLSSQADCHWMAFNIGDSRVYLWDESELRQITVDHSVVQELVDGGEITAEEALTHPERNFVTRAVGVEREADPDVWLLPAEGRQVFVVCSDGLTRELTDAEIAEVLAQELADPAARLIELALASGARDNVTVLVVDATSTDTTPPSPGYHDSKGLGSLERTLPRT